MIKKKNLTYYFFGIILLVQLGSHAPVFQKDLSGLHVWRQTQTQNTINSFVEEDFNILNPRRNERGSGEGIFRMEFPLMQWITAIPVKIFGHSVVVSRIMNFVYTLFGFLGFFMLVGTFYSDIRLRRWLSLAFWFSPLLYYYMVNPMPDNLALSLGVWGLFYIQKWKINQDRGAQILALSFFTLASLVKLPYLIYFAAYAWVVLFGRAQRDGHTSLKRNMNLLVSILLGILFVLPVLGWYVWVIPDWEGNGIVQGIFNMTSEQKSSYIYYSLFHLRSTLPELIMGWPLVPFFVIGLWISIKRFKSSIRNYGHFFAIGLALVFFVLFEMNMIEKVHDYYFMPLIPIVFLFIARGFRQLAFRQSRRNWKTVVAIILIASMPLYSFLRIQSRWNRPGFNPDLTTYKKELRAVVPDDALVCVGNDPSHHIFLYYVQKMGWAFENDWINPDKLQEMIDQGCRYLYCDSRKIDQNPSISKLFGTKVAQYGTISVYELTSDEKIIDF